MKTNLFPFNILKTQLPECLMISVSIQDGHEKITHNEIIPVGASMKPLKGINKKTLSLIMLELSLVDLDKLEREKRLVVCAYTPYSKKFNNFPLRHCSRPGIPEMPRIVKEVLKNMAALSSLNP